MKQVLCLAALLCIHAAYAQELYKVPPNTQTRWSSFENKDAEKGAGGKENSTAKGHAFDVVKPGTTVELLNVKGAGKITRIWLTLNKRSPKMLRSLVIQMFWDGAASAAVSAPLGDFFGVGLGRTAKFENALFSNPEGRSFNCYIPMPFKTGARIVIKNEADEEETLFYDVDFLKSTTPEADALYFHSYWAGNQQTNVGDDFEILPQVKGRGRFLGANFGIIADSSYGKSWWGEGEVKIYLDGDNRFATLVGTGTEDYIGTGWGQGTYTHNYQGCSIADTAKNLWTFYRYHVPDPVYFTTGCKVAIQQIGGDGTDNVRKLVNNGAKLVPVSVAGDKFYKLFEMNPAPSLTDSSFPAGWTNFYRKDNYSATVYFYLDKPTNGLPAIAPLSQRLFNLKDD